MDKLKDQPQVGAEDAILAARRREGTRPVAIGQGRRTLRVIRQNVVASLAVKAVFVVLAPLGLTTLVLAVVADLGTSLLVTLNALRLLGAGRGGPWALNRLTLTRPPSLCQRSRPPPCSTAPSRGTPEGRPASVSKAFATAVRLTEHRPVAHPRDLSQARRQLTRGRRRHRRRPRASLVGVVRDQAELHGILQRISDLGLTLLSASADDEDD